MTTETNVKIELLKLATNVVVSYVARNDVAPEQLSTLLHQVFSAVSSIHGSHSYPALRGGNSRPAVPIEESVHHDYIVCLEDGKRLQMLKRHLKTVYNLSVEQYRERWNLPVDYPSVSPSYAKRRSAIARSSGLGQAGRKNRILNVA